jgi:uncharacterized integral membrane protein
VSTDPAVGNGKKGLSGKAIVAGVLGILALIFIFQNTGSNSVHLFFWEVRLPSWVWLLVLFLVGVAVGSVFPWFRRGNRRA